jgi:aspartate ammonia-lyase
MRREKDFIGEMELDDNVLYGIHSARARENFPDATPFHVEWFKAMALTKKACYVTAAEFFSKASQQYDLEKMNIRGVSIDRNLEVLVESAAECEKGEHFEHFIVPAISGGAGTSINMNVNEILANRALQKLGNKPGDYTVIDPIEDANIFQSTNDVVPTALRVATMTLLLELEHSINDMRKVIEELEKDTAIPCVSLIHRCRRRYLQPTAGFSAVTVMHCRATGGGCQNAWNALRWSTSVDQRSAPLLPSRNTLWLRWSPDCSR